MKLKLNYYHLVPLFILIFFQISLIGQSQSGSISGTLTDKATGETLIGANVVIEGTSIGGSSDFDGNYRVATVSPGEYTLKATYLGYKEATKVVTVSENQNTKIDFELEFMSVQLEGEEIVITAQAEGQIGAINRQLGSNTIANVISAKKIQEVPDANAAEAVGRLPGVSIVRSGGEGSKVVIRGLAPKYNKIQIEGVKMASTGGADRSSDLSTISPYMLDGIEVSKAAMPDKEADVLGGSVNFILRGAPDKPKLDAIVQTGYNSLRNKFGDYKVVLGGSRRFFKKKLGIFAQLDVERRRRSSDEVQVSYFNTNLLGPQEDIDVSVNNIILQDISRDNERLGGVAVLDYRLKNGEIKWSTFISGIERNDVNRFENLRPQLRDHYYNITQTNSNLLIRNSALKWNQNFGNFTIDVGVSNAYSKNNIPESHTMSAFENIAWDNQKTITDPNNPDKEISFDLELPPEVLVKFAKNDIDNTIISNLSSYNSITSESENAAGIDLSYNWQVNDHNSIRFKTGVKIKQLDKTFDKNVTSSSTQFGTQSSKIRDRIFENYPAFGSVGNSKLNYIDFIDPDYNNSDFAKNTFDINNIPSLTLANDIYNLTKDLYQTDYPNSIKDDYSGKENYQAAYVMATVNIGKEWTLIPGVRFENNQTEYTGIRGNSEAQLWFNGYVHHDTTTTRKNSFILPMFHLKYKPQKWFDIRLAYTNTLTRPDFNRIVPSWNKSIQSIAYNDPFLKASPSQNFDAYASFYGSKLGLLTVGGFYKNIKDLIYSAGTAQILDAEALGLDESDTNKNYEKWINNPNPVNLYGIELEWQTRFWYLSDSPYLSFLKGMVFNVNYTHTISEVKYPRNIVEVEYIPEFKVTNRDTFYTDRLILQPNDLFNVTIGYDYKGFSIRGSMLYQNDIFSATNFWERHRVTTDQYIKYDISMRQKLPIEGMEVLVNLNNISSAVDRDINQGTGYIVKEQHYGMTLDLGLRYRIQ